MTLPWEIFVIAGTGLTLVATAWLIYWSGHQGPEPSETVQDTGHSWDGLTERNEPLPRWWLGLFILTILFSIGYLVIYPGLGNYAGTLGWSQATQYQEEVDAAEARLAPLFASFSAIEDNDLLGNADALRIGESLFANYCTQCHGSLGYGARSFPNLTDNDWLYGDSFSAIETSILNGRSGIMPPLGAVFANEQALADMVVYVQNLSAGSVDSSSPAHAQFTALCGACHGPNGEGLAALGAPRLNDDIWLYGGSREAIADVIVNGRQGVMPAHEKLLGEDRVRLLTAYVKSLSGTP